MRFVFQAASDEASCFAGKRRAFEEASKGRSDQGVAGSGRWTGVSSGSEEWSSG